MFRVSLEIREVEGHGEVILLAEDDELLRKSISEFLGMHGYKVLAASTGAQALLIAKHHADSIQVLITDMILPKMGGAEIAQEVAKTCPQVPVLYMSGYSEHEALKHDPATSVDFIQKPFTLQGFLQKLREMLTQRGS